MRRSAAILLFAFLVPSLASAAPARAPVGPLTVGIFNDPATIVGVTIWVILQTTRVLTIADELTEQFKEDVRRMREHPQRVLPQIVPKPAPVPLPVTPVLPPLRSGRPGVIVDRLPAGVTS